VRSSGLNIPYDLPIELNNFCSFFESANRVMSPQLQILPLPNLHLLRCMSLFMAQMRSVATSAFQSLSKEERT
jgi:hypothetical protein